MNNIYSYQFTIFTPTFNRSHLLINVYDSLKKQSFKNFEWLIVDDGSTDNTENLVANWVKENTISIRYFKQENQGKHVAVNFGVQNAKGEFFLIIDSDDFCIDNALEKFISYWNNISETKKSEFAGIMSVCINKEGKTIGDEFPAQIIDVSFIDMYYRLKIKGDKWGFFLTNILKEFPFPVIDNENFITEALVWNRIALKYKTRFINEKLLVVAYQNDGLSSSSLKMRMKNPFGAILYYKEFISLPVSFIWKFRNYINYLRFSFHANKQIFQQITNINNHLLKIFTIIALPVAYFMYINDNIKINK